MDDEKQMIYVAQSRPRSYESEDSVRNVYAGISRLRAKKLLETKGGADAYWIIEHWLDGKVVEEEYIKE